jgi:hypothetical protein
MNHKDIHNIYNIYRNVLKETKIGDGMSQPIQLGSGMSKGGPSSDVLLKVKKKKTKKVKKINEGILSGLGSFSKGVVQGIQSAQQGKFPTLGTNKKPEKDKKIAPEAGKQIYISKKNDIRGLVVSNVNQNGDYKVRLIGKTITDPSPYKFFKTKKYPNGVIASQNKLDPSDTILSKSETLLMGPNKNYDIIAGL